MSLSLTITDNAATNGGGIATITGSLGATVSLYKATVTVSAIGSYSVLDTRVGDGTIALTGTGYFSWYATTPAPLTSNTVYQPLTTEGDSVHWRAITMLADRITALALPGLGNGGVLTQYGGDSSNIDFPCILLSLPGETETSMGGTNTQDDFALPVSTWILDRVPWASNIYAQRMLNWRERMRLAINEQHWDARVPEVKVCRYKPNLIIEPAQKVIEYRASLGTVECVARQGRRATSYA